MVLPSSFPSHRFVRETKTRGDICITLGCPGGSDGGEYTCNAGDLGLIPGSGSSPGGGNGNACWYSCIYIYVCVCVCVCVCVFVYILFHPLYIYTHTHICILLNIGQKKV